MAESNLPKQDFAPPWLKFPSTDSSKTPSQNSYQSERSNQRKDDSYHSRSEYNRLQRQTSFDFHDAKRYPQSQGKYRHHSVDDDYYGYPYGAYGYYAPSYNYEKYGMQYSSQPSLARPGSRDGKYAPGRFSQMNGVGFSPHYDLFEPYYHQGPAKRGYYDKEQHLKDVRDVDGKTRDRDGDRDRPFSEDFPLLRGTGEGTPEVKHAKPASGVWENPPKSSRHEESPDLLKNSSTGIYKAFVPSKTGQMKKNGRDAVRVNGSIKDSSPVSPSNKPNHKEGTRQSPTPDLAIVTQPKKLGDKKSEFLRALRSESNQRNGDAYQDLNQNSIEKKQATKETDESPMSEDASYYPHVNGSNETHRKNHSHERIMNGNNLNDNANQSSSGGECTVNGDSLIKHVDHIYLSGEEEEKRLLESMGWSEEDQTEYVITDDDVREFHHMLSRVREQSECGDAVSRSVLRLKLGTQFANGLLNGTYHENVDSDKHESL
jgi:hypothetical protein